MARPKSPTFAAAILGEEDVGGLEVAVDDALGVEVRKRSTDIRGHRKCSFNWRRAILEQAGDVAAGHVLLDDEWSALLFTDIEDAHEMRVRTHAAHCLGFADGAGRVLGLKAFDADMSEGNVAVEAGVMGQEDALATTLPEEAAHLIAPGDEGLGIASIRGAR